MQKPSESPVRSPLSGERGSWAQFDLLVSHLQDGVTVQGTDGKLVYSNQAAAIMSGYASAAEVLAAPVGDYVKRFQVMTADGAPMELQDLPGRIALKTGSAQAVMRVRDRLTGAERWSDVRSYAVRGDDGDVMFVVNVIRDTTESVRQLRQLEPQKAREEFLSRATAILGSSLDYKSTLDTVARLVVPELADWCSVDLRDEDDSIRQLAVAHVDPEKVRWARELRVHSPPRMDQPRGLPEVLRTGQPEFYPNITDEMLQEAAHDAQELALLRTLGFTSAMIVPLLANERTVGALTLVATESSKHYAEPDLAFAMELGRRAGMAVERAELHAMAVKARSDAERALAHSQAHAEWLARLHHLSLVLSRTVTEDDIGRAVTADARHAFGGEISTLLMESEPGTLRLVASVGLPADVVGRYATVPSDAPIPAARCTQTGEPVLLGSVEEYLDAFPNMGSLIRASTVRATAAFPVRVGGETIGALSFSYAQSRSFDDDYVNAARVFAKEVGQAWDRMRMRAEAEAARAAAERSDRAKSDFLATMSHELRTPINAIVGFTGLMAEGIAGPLSARQEEYLARIRASTDVLLTLINDVLDLAKIESGKLEVKSEIAPVVATVEEAVGMVRAAAESRRLSLTWSGDEGLRYVGDRDRIRQVLLNLLWNAVKFTPPGGTIRAAAVDAGVVDGGARMVRIEVEDTGIGIPADSIERIFEPFTQGESVYTREHGGTGLGLSISRRLARMMGGDVTVKSQPGRGSCFMLTLPSAP